MLNGKQFTKTDPFYDGRCPLCQAEILFLSRRNHDGLLAFIDIHSQDYDPAKVGVSCEQALAAMYGQYADGVLINGPAVFPEAYRRASLPLLAWLFSRKLLQPSLRLGYQWFAKHRHAISRVLGPSALRLVMATSKRDSMSVFTEIFSDCSATLFKSSSICVEASLWSSDAVSVIGKQSSQNMLLIGS